MKTDKYNFMLLKFWEMLVKLMKDLLLVGQDK